MLDIWKCQLDQDQCQQLAARHVSRWISLIEYNFLLNMHMGHWQYSSQPNMIYVCWDCILIFGHPVHVNSAAKLLSDSSVLEWNVGLGTFSLSLFVLYAICFIFVINSWSSDKSSAILSIVSATYLVSLCLHCLQDSKPLHFTAVPKFAAFVVDVCISCFHVPSLLLQFFWSFWEGSRIIKYYVNFYHSAWIMWSDVLQKHFDIFLHIFHCRKWLNHEHPLHDDWCWYPWKNCYNDRYRFVTVL